MNLSKRTKDVLANFAVINPSLQFREGNILKTVSPSKDMLAVATVPEVFPKDFAIYDISRLLGALSLFDEPELSFKDQRLTIKSDQRTINYTYASPKMIIAPPNNSIETPPVVAKFDLSAKSLDEISKVVSLMKLPEVIFEGDGSDVTVRVTEVKNPTGDSYRNQVGKTDQNFSVVFKDAKIQKLISDDYSVTITHGPLKGQVASLIIFESKDVKYYVAPETDSKFD